MNISLEEFKRLEEENRKLKQVIKKYKVRINNTVSNTEVEFILNKLIPNMAEDVIGQYEVFIEMCCPKLDYLELIRVITFLLKTNREDLAEFYCHFYLAERNLDNAIKGKQEVIDEYRNILIELSKEIDLKRNSTEIRLKILFEILSYQPTEEFPSVILEILEQNIYKFTDIIFDTRNDYWFIRMFDIISINHPKLLHKYLDYLYGHWDFINNWIYEGNLPIWDTFVKQTNHIQMERSIAALKEYWNAKKHGLNSNQKTTYTIDTRQTEQSISNSKIDTKEWMKFSELRKHGYEVNKNKTIEERRIALHKAMKHIPLSKIQSHIQWLLKNAYKKDGVRGDFSNSINAYEMDLKYLQKIFHKH
ncbi:hypothetical protein [Solibacillus sp. FSL W8-0372]|uniref:hypothetical protein n=1 Tax=Solibacillus sp. FSL W8-0372 TaxID=2921713 RepID=UPI0030D03C39